MKKILIFLPDGVGLKNFAFGNFNEIGKSLNFEIEYWNNTSFPLSDLNLKSISVKAAKHHPLSDLFKRAITLVELRLNYKKYKDEAYLSYIFPANRNSFKNFFKTSFVDFLTLIFKSENGLKFLRAQLYKLERKTEYYKKSKKELKSIKPDIIFLTNQRPLTAVAPILAAQDLKIPTATFIFSWDNLPKATKVIKSDYYFVWSKFMQQELLKYYPTVKESQTLVTGTPQFECHYKTTLDSKEIFFKTYKLDLEKKYICFSGDDVTTSPNDQFYLEDTAKAVRSLNKKGYNLGIIYRKCPVDFTDRHLEIYKKFKDVISLIDPKWNNLGNNWNQVMPLPEDLALLANTVKYTEMVINVGSSMAFDYAAQNKPCAFLNYETKKKVNNKWDIHKIYKFIHFKSMPHKDSVLWIDSENEIESAIVKVLESNYTMTHVLDWYTKIAGKTPNNASKKIWYTLKDIVDKTRN
ncbi:UDP-glycosyltransferase [Polaribacter aestuariivivens]|uniref:UDP-glycosyltransferase n=1 Tax=Polaribacter aestuariivivens TaxID=2304626 RepID=UPI003F495BDF